MKASHVTGGGLATFIAIVVFKTTGWQLSDSDALAVGAAVLSVGAGIGHVLSTVGVKGAWRLVLQGQGSTPPAQQ